VERTNRTGRPVWRAALLTLCLMTAPMAAQASSPAAEFGRGVTTVLVNVAYIPAKLLYATGGGLVTLVAYAFSGGDAEVARPIATSSLRGDYVLSEAQLFGEEEIAFVGRQPEHQQAREQGWDVAAPAEPEGF